MIDISQSIKQVDESLKEKTAIRQDFHKHILTIASTFLAVLIALHRQPSQTLYIHILWSASLAILLLGILSGAACLYGLVYYSTQGHSLLVEAVKKQARSASKTFEPVFVKPKRIFELAEQLEYVLLPSSVVLFTIYAILIDAL